MAAHAGTGGVVSPCEACKSNIPLYLQFLDDHSNVLELMANGCRKCSTLVDRHILNRSALGRRS